MYIALLILGIVDLSLAHREHKVHNIVLYPEKHSWCKTTPIKQVVGHPGCETLEVDNNVCVGACFSYSIPRTEPTAPGEVAPYCDSCQPSRVTWKHVTLKRTEGPEGETLTKKVEIIENCSCLACRPNESHGHPTLDVAPSSSPSLLTNVVPSSDGIGAVAPSDDDKNNNDEDLHEPPQLLNVMEGPPKMNTSHIQQGSKLNLLLKMLAGAEEDPEKADAETTEQRISSLVEIIKHKGVSDEELQGLVQKSEGTGQLKVDLIKLKEILQKIEGRNEIETAENNEKQAKADDVDETDDADDDDEEEEVKPERPMRHEHHRTPIVHHAKLNSEGEEEEHNPTLDVPHHHLRPAVEGDEIAYLPHHHTPHHHHHSQTPEE